MLSLEIILTFLTASLLLALAPGPDNLFVLTLSALYGRAAGLVVVLGLCTGLIVHTTAVALGVAAVLQSSTGAFAAIKFVGAVYLAYLAWQAFRAGVSQSPANPTNRLDYPSLYRRGILMNLTNPKVSLFFLAFLPQFADPVRGSVAVQILLLGGLFILATILIFGGIALLAGTLSQVFLRSKRVQVTLHQLAGVVFAGLALKLLATD